MRPNLHSMLSAAKLEAARFVRSSWAVDLLGAALLTAWYYRYGWGHLHDHLYDTFDQKGMIWALEWLRHCFFGTGTVAAVFDTNMLFPNTNTLAWSDTMLGFLPLYAAARVFTGNPILALNSVAVSCVLLGTLGMFRLAREVTGRTGLIAASVGGVGLVVASMEGHFQLKALALLIWAALFLVRFLRAPSTGSLAWLGALILWLFLSSIYLAIMLAVFVSTLLVVAVAAYRVRVLEWARGAIAAVRLLPAAAPFLTMLVPSAWVGWHYLQVQHAFGGYGLGEFVVYSARFSSLFDAPPTSLVYPTLFDDWGSQEARMSFGLLVYLSIALLFVGWRGSLVVKAERRALLVCGLGAVLGIVLALGPYERNAFAHGTHIPLPALLYAKIFPGFGALRTVGRFAVFAAIFMGVLAEAGVRGALDRLSLPRRRAAYLAIAGAVWVEQTTVMRPIEVDLFPRRAVYQAIANDTPPDAVVLELPVSRGDHYATISWWHDQMLGSTLHWRRIPVGFTSLSSTFLNKLSLQYRRLEAGKLEPRAFLRSVEALGITHVVLDHSLVPGGVARGIEAAAIERGLSQREATPGVTILGRAFR